MLLSSNIPSQKIEQPNKHTLHLCLCKFDLPDEHPGLLWDPVEEEWVDDPDYGGDE